MFYIQNIAIILLPNNRTMTQQKTVIGLRVLYFLWVIVGIFSIVYVPSVLIVSGDAAQTAQNITENMWMFHAGIVGSLITQLIYIFVVLLLYKLFQTVNKTQASFMLVLALVAVPIAMINTLNRVGAILVLNGSSTYLNVFSTDQIHALMMLFLDMNQFGVYIASIFWGLWLFPLGYLISKSGYFPKNIGFFVMLGGVGYLVESFGNLLIPEYTGIASLLMPVANILEMGELVFLIWIVFIGAKLPQKS